MIVFKPKAYLASYRAGAHHDLAYFAPTQVSIPVSHLMQRYIQLLFITSPWTRWANSGSANGRPPSGRSLARSCNVSLSVRGRLHSFGLDIGITRRIGIFGTAMGRHLPLPSHHPQTLTCDTPSLPIGSEPLEC